MLEELYIELTAYGEDYCTNTEMDLLHMTSDIAPTTVDYGPRVRRTTIPAIQSFGVTAEAMMGTVLAFSVCASLRRFVVSDLGCPHRVHRKAVIIANACLQWRFRHDIFVHVLGVEYVV